MPEIIKLANEFDSVYVELQRAIKENNFHDSIDIMGYLLGLKSNDNCFRL